MIVVQWIQTYTGRQFFPLDPREDDLDIEDIAHSLSRQCRFNGHCRDFYSVAEHAVRVSRAVSENHALWGLLHDAGEAYLTDLPRPIKDQIGIYRDLENQLLKVVARRYGLRWPIPVEVDVADTALLITEARDLLVAPPVPWGLEAEPLEEVIVPWSMDEAKSVFLARFEELI